MKKILISALLILSTLTFVHGQITYEAAYPNDTLVSSTFDLHVIRLTAFGSKYLVIKTGVLLAPDTLLLYSLNHTLYKTIVLAPFAPSGYHGASYISYITNALFDTDTSDIEYLVNLPASCPNCIDNKVKVFDESGNLLLDLDSASSGSGLPLYNDPFPVVETDSGAKLVVFKRLNNSAGWPFAESHIYSLPGHLPCPVCEGGNGSQVAINEHNPASEDFLLSDPYPNPANSSFKIEYRLPANAKTGSITFYDTQGNKIKSYKIDIHSNTLILNAAEFASGTFYYQLITDTRRSIGKKMLVIK